MRFDDAMPGLSDDRFIDPCLRRACRQVMADERYTPRYDTVDDILLIGVDHQPFENGRPEACKELGLRLRTLDDCSFETDGYPFEQGLSNNFETSAYRMFRGNKHFLDADADYPAMMEQEGVPGIMTGLFALQEYMQQVVVHSRDARDAKDAMTAMLRELRRPGQHMQALLRYKAPDAARDVYYDLIVDIHSGDDASVGESMGQVMQATHAFTRHLAVARDHYQYAPRLTAIRDASAGSTDAILKRMPIILYSPLFAALHE
ncbi:hypothetical protein AUJ68_03880 [Candidatus Woesearchaeota archaeon CG1_02_57_44]|nr:MAG: hypothetical protein AUJ68_03880 [Candidatus Woesearchaeota archaeon CG1_02_57_44]